MTTVNGCMLQGFSWYLDADSEHWNRLVEDAKIISDSGITAIWLPPAYKGQGGAEDVGYGVYDLWDLGEFDQRGSVATKYGTKDQYLAAIKALQDVGIQVLGDIVLNHRMGGDACEDVPAREANPQNRNEISGDLQTIKAWTSFTFPGRHGTYDDFAWNWTHFHGTDWDENTQRSSVFLFDGKHWDQSVDHNDNGNYDYLMGCDVDVSYQPVYDQLVKWGKWYVDTTGVDGFRLDALKHMSRDFYLRWLSAMREYTGRELFTVGEYWSPNLDDLRGYLGDSEIMSLFDVPLHYKLFQASNSMGQMDLSHLFDGTLVQVDPIHAVTFVENHDTQPGQALQSFIEAWFKPSAYAIILLREAGYPCVFFGDLFGMPNDGGIPAVKELPLLMEVRRRFAYGPQHDYLDNPDVIGWTREGVDDMEVSGCAVVLTDKEHSEKNMYVGTRHANERWICVMGEENAVNIDEGGNATFPVGDGKCSVYLPESAANILSHDYKTILRHSKSAVNPESPEQPIAEQIEEGAEQLDQDRQQQ